MKNIIVIFVLFTVLSCKSHKIDLSGDYDFVVENRKIATLNLTQVKTGKLNGFLYWSPRNDVEFIFKITGQINLDNYQVNLEVESEGSITVSNPCGNYLGYVANSKSIAGTNPVKWMAVRK